MLLSFTSLHLRRKISAAHTIASPRSPVHFNKGPLENNPFKKSITFILADTLEYIPNSVLIKTIFKKHTGNVSAFSFDRGEMLTEKITPFDIFIQVIDGSAEIILNGESNVVETGESIIIPAHCSTVIKANVRFKMLSTLIKSGYDEVS